jgi:hypothetical protein
MCAAPGSKTFQLLEMLHAGPAPPTGLVVANDADAMRCNLLCHQTKRMCSPHLVVTHHEAQGFPLLRDLDPASPDTHVLFDRILCDVPCSGGRVVGGCGCGGWLGGLCVGGGGWRLLSGEVGESGQALKGAGALGVRQRL